MTGWDVSIQVECSEEPTPRVVATIEQYVGDLVVGISETERWGNLLSFSGVFLADSAAEALSLLTAAARWEAKRVGVHLGEVREGRFSSAEATV